MEHTAPSFYVVTSQLPRQITPLIPRPLLQQLVLTTMAIDPILRQEPQLFLYIRGGGGGGKGPRQLRQKEGSRQDDCYGLARTTPK